MDQPQREVLIFLVFLIVCIVALYTFL